MKRLIALAVILCFILSLFACQEQEADYDTSLIGLSAPVIHFSSSKELFVFLKKKNVEEYAYDEVGARAYLEAIERFNDIGYILVPHHDSKRGGTNTHFFYVNSETTDAGIGYRYQIYGQWFLIMLHAYDPSLVTDTENVDLLEYKRKRINDPNYQMDVVQRKYELLPMYYKTLDLYCEKIQKSGCGTAYRVMYTKGDPYYITITGVSGATLEQALAIVYGLELKKEYIE